MPDEMKELISFGGDAEEIKFFTFDSQKFILNFTTNEVGIDTGFNLTIKRIKRNKECSCHATDSNLKILDGKKNSVEKKIDVKKCPFMDCFWEIQPPKASKFYHQLIVKFNLSLVDNGTFVKVCPKNFHRIYSMCQRLDSKEVGFEKSLGLHIFNFSKYSKLNASVNIWYHREHSSLNSQEIINPNIQRQINFTYEWRERCECGDTHLKADKDQWKVLYSPDHPSKYCASMNCLWHLEAPEGFHIVLNISEFNTEKNHDFLSIYDGNDTDQKHLEMFSGLIKFNNTIKSKQNIMTISFHSDIDTQMNGFTLWYKAVIG